MRKILTVCLLLCFLGHPKAFSQEYVFNAHWLKHECQTYRLKHTQYTLYDGDTVALEVWTAKSEVLIEDSSTLGFKMHWRLSDFKIQTDHHLSKQWVARQKNFHLSYWVSPFGVIRQEPDFADFETQLDQAYDRFFPEYGAQTQQHSRDRLLELVQSWKQGLEEMVEQYHQAHGRAYRLGERIEMPVKVLAPVSGEPVDAVQYKKLQSVEQGVAGLVTATVVDTARTACCLQADGALMMHLPTGWPVYSYLCKEVSEGKTVVGEISEFRLE